LSLTRDRTPRKRCGVKMGEKFEVLATNSIGDDMFIATPAVAGNSMYFRGRNTLYCIRQAH
jgi:hypothetical protein